MYKDMMDTIGMVNAADPELGAMERELTRQRENIELIASENIVSPAVMAAMGSVLTNKYAEGLPGKRYYGGCVYVDEVENIAIRRACQLFGAKYANVQPHSGAQANLAVYFALLELGDTVMGMDLSQGGHLTHGSPVNMSGKNYHFISYGVGADGVIDYAELEKQVRKVRPKMLVAGASAYPRAIDFEKLAALFLKYWDKFLIDGVEYTLALAAITVAFGAVFASVLALMKMSKIPPLRWLSTIYIEIIRGTPMLLQLYFFYFGLPMLIPALNKQKFLCIAIALICNSAAYVSEVIRSGIQAVDPGQREAALSLGFSESKAMWFVVVPQAVKNILPALGNEFIMIIKDTSLGSTFFIGDLMTQYLVVKGATYLPIEPLVIVGVIYFLMTFILSKVFGHFEKKMQKADRHSGYERKRKQQREVHV